jgi:TP901 family phage tail tape measure protein
MADEIKQVMGFDAAQALETLGQLDSGFLKFQNNLNSSINTFDRFNKGAGKTVSALIQIATRANAAADAMERLNKVQPPPSTPGGGLPGLPGNAGNLLTGQAAADAMNALLGQTTSQANNAATAVNNFGRQATATFNRGSRAASGFALSLETITRVIGTQLIVRGLNAIRNAVEDSFQGFTDYNRALAEIQTISPEPIENYARQVRQLSDDFNSPLLTVAKAKYDIVSNGFQTAADSTSILTAALKLSKIGLADVSQAADLLATSLNAYGKSAAEADTLAAKLFRTVDVGRVDISELANAFGRVAPIGKEIGATEDELLAAFSSITIGGVKASEAATQIRATLTALLKPSEAASKAMRQLGFESGEQLIQAKGFKGALDALISTTDGSATSIAALFPNVRALNGVLRETGTGAAIFESHLKQIQETARETLNRTFELRISSDAEKVSADLNKLKNFFTVELGSQLVETTATTLKLVGGVETLIDVLGAVAPVAGFTVAALTGYGAVMGAASLANNVFTTSVTQANAATQVFRGTLLTLGLALAAYSTGKFVGGQITRMIEADRRAAEDAASQLLSFQRDQAEARASLDKAETDQKFRALNDAVAITRAAYFKQVDVAREANKQLIDNDKATLDKIISARDKFAQDLRRASQQASKDIIDSEKRTNDARAALADQRFDFQNRNNNSLTKSFNERNRAEALGQQAALDLMKAKTEEEQAAAQAAFSRAEAFARQALSSADASKNITAQVNAERTLEGILAKRIQAEEQFRKGRAEDVKKLNEQAALEEARVTQMKQLAKTFLDNSKLFDRNSGDPLSKDRIDEQVATAKKALADFKKLAFEGSAKFDLSDLFAFDKLETRLTQSFTQGEVQQLFASDSALDALRNQIQGSLSSSDFIVSLASDPSKLEGKSAGEQIREVEAQIKAQQEGANSLRQAALERAAAEREIASNAKLSAQIYNEQRGALEGIARAGKLLMAGITPGIEGDHFTEIQAEQQLAKLRAETQALQNDAAATVAQVTELGNRFRSFERTAPSLVSTDLTRAKEEYNLLVATIEKRRELRDLDAAGLTDQAAADAAKTLEANAQRAEAVKRAAEAEKAAKEASQGSAANAQSMKTSFDASVSATARIASNLANAARSALTAAEASQQIGATSAEAATAAMGGLMQRFQSGGLVKPRYLAGGGQAKGTDNIPALLTQDEFVVNAQSSRRFFSQLQAINAGVTPSFNSSPPQAGATINIGDININEAASAKDTARQVMDLIRREERRGTGTFR